MNNANNANNAKMNEVRNEVKIEVRKMNEVRLNMQKAKWKLPIVVLALAATSFLLLPGLSMKPSLAAKSKPKAGQKSAKSSDKKFALAKEVFKLSGSEQELRQVVQKLMSQQIRSSKISKLAKFLTRGDKVVQDKFTKALTQVFEKDIDMVSEISDAIAKGYAKEFSEDELKTLVKYYESPTGKKGLKISRQFSKDISDLKKSVLGPQINSALKEAIKSETGLSP